MKYFVLSVVCRRMNSDQRMQAREFIVESPDSSYRSCRKAFDGTYGDSWECLYIAGIVPDPEPQTKAA